MRSYVLSFFLLALLLFYGCTSLKKESQPTTYHFSDSLYAKLESLYKSEGKRDGAFRYADSVLTTFPDISVADKCRYLDFCRDMFYNLPLSRYSIDSAIQFTDSILLLIEQNKLTKAMQKEYSKAFRDKGELYSSKHNYDSAIIALNKSKQLALAERDLCGVAKGMLTQCGIAVMQSKFEYAAQLLHEALGYAEKCPEDGSKFYMMQRFKDDLGYAFSMQKKYDSALFYHLAAEQYILSNKHLKTDDTLFPYRALLNVYDNISGIYEQQGNYTAAEKYINQSLGIVSGILKDKEEIIKTKIQLGFIYAASGRLSEAELLVKKLDPEMNTLTANYQMYFLQLAMNVSRALKRYEERSFYADRFYVIRDSLTRVEIELQRKDPITQFERMDKIHQVELLKKDNRIKQSRITAAIIIGCLLALLTLIILFSLQRIRNVMKKRAVLYKELVKSEQSLKKAIEEREIQEKQKREEALYFQEIRLQIQHNEAIMNQRQRISEDLHDDLSGSLVALGYYVEDMKLRLDNQEAQKSMESIGEEIRHIYTNARKYMHDLKASGMMSQYDLPLLLEEMKRKFEEKTSLKFVLDIDKSNVVELLNIHQHDQLYHIINEALTNIIKHAKASVVRIAIGFDETGCKFSIIDDGTGFNTADAGAVAFEGLGLKSMQRRMKELYGDLSIQSGVDGTTINGHFPLS